jgi:hypothetical protein
VDAVLARLLATVESLTARRRASHSSYDTYSLTFRKRSSGARRLVSGAIDRGAPWRGPSSRSARAPPTARRRHLASRHAGLVLRPEVGARGRPRRPLAGWMGVARSPVRDTAPRYVPLTPSRAVSRTRGVARQSGQGAWVVGVGLGDGCDRVGGKEGERDGGARADDRR